MSAFILKIIAVITMFCDHIGYLVMGKFSFFNYIGRIAFPIFAFQISEGYIHTKNKFKYLKRLFWFALISQIPFMLFEHTIGVSFSLNIFFTLIFGLLAILLYDKIKNKFLGIVCAIILAIIANFIKCDYGFYGVSIITIFYIFKNNKVLMSLAFSSAVLIKYSIKIFNYNHFKEYVFLALSVIFSLFFILLYNGKKGKNTKYFLYFFYPIHLLLICFLYLILQN